MSEEEFSALSLPDKWKHIKQTMDYIVRMDSMYDMRTRLNPHHSKQDKKLEERSVRLDQGERWSHIKNLYAGNRDELVDTLGAPEFEECKRIIEKVFTTELDDVLRDVIEE